jgi:hypothetical protein
MIAAMTPLNPAARKQARPKSSAMIVGLAVAASLVAIPSAVHAAKKGFSEWATIYNKRFGFSIAYPSEILMPVDTPSGNPDGRVLQSADGKAKLLVATFENADKLSLDGYRDFLLADVYAKAKIDYAPQKSRWFVLSGERGDQTFYERVTFSCGGRLINSWAMVYPTADKRLYDRVVSAVAKTYTAGSGADGTCEDIAAADPDKAEGLDPAGQSRSRPAGR